MRRSSCSELTGQSPTLLSRGNCQPGQQNAGSHRSCQNQSAVTVKQHTKGTVPEKPSPSEPVNWMERLNQMKPVGDAEQNSEAFVVQEHLIRVYLPGGGTQCISGALCTGKQFFRLKHHTLHITRDSVIRCICSEPVDAARMTCPLCGLLHGKVPVTVCSVLNRYVK